MGLLTYIFDKYSVCIFRKTDLCIFRKTDLDIPMLSYIRCTSLPCSGGWPHTSPSKTHSFVHNQRTGAPYVLLLP